jgi:cytochrome c biogenesis protein CcmG, thiol:disulfide interchange protein DsbE
MKRLSAPRIAAIAVGLVMVALIAVLATRKSAVELERSSPLIGRIAPEISGEDVLTGKSARLSDRTGQWVLLNFFASWCVPCAKEHPELVKFQEQHQAAGDVSVFAAVFEDQPKGIKAFFKQKGGNWPVVDNTRAAVDYGVTGVPESYLIAPNGVVMGKLTGGVKLSSLESALTRFKAMYAEAVPTTVVP